MPTKLEVALLNAIYGYGVAKEAQLEIKELN